MALLVTWVMERLFLIASFVNWDLERYITSTNSNKFWDAYQESLTMYRSKESHILWGHRLDPQLWPHNIKKALIHSTSPVLYHHYTWQDLHFNQTINSEYVIQSPYPPKVQLNLVQDLSCNNLQLRQANNSSTKVS